MCRVCRWAAKSKIVKSSSSTNLIESNLPDWGPRSIATLSPAYAALSAYSLVSPSLALLLPHQPGPISCTAWLWAQVPFRNAQSRVHAKRSRCVKAFSSPSRLNSHLKSSYLVAWWWWSKQMCRCAMLHETIAWLSAGRLPIPGTLSWRPLQWWKICTWIFAMDCSSSMACASEEAASCCESFCRSCITAWSEGKQ